MCSRRRHCIILLAQERHLPRGRRFYERLSPQHLCRSSLERARGRVAKEAKICRRRTRKGNSHYREPTNRRKRMPILVGETFNHHQRFNLCISLLEAWNISLFSNFCIFFKLCFLTDNRELIDYLITVLKAHLNIKSLSIDNIVSSSGNVLTYSTRTNISL